MKLSRRWQLAAILLVALTVRLAAGWYWQSRLVGAMKTPAAASAPLFGMGDSDGYWRLAQCIAEGKPYQYLTPDRRIFRTPGYPLLLAPVVRLAGAGQTGVLVARAEAALLGTLAVLGVWWLARLLFDDRAARLAAALAAVYPGAVIFGALILGEAPFCPLMLLQLGLWIVAFRAPSAGRMSALAFVAGVVAGLATLMRPSWLLFTPLAALLSLFVRRGSTFGRQAAIALSMLLGLAIAMTPWWIRNARAIGHFVPTTLQVGASLYDGLNPRATGASNFDVIPPELTEAGLQAKAGQNPTEPLEWRLDRRMRQAAIDWAWANPGQTLQLAGIKLSRMWNVWPNEPTLASRWTLRWAVFFTYTPLLFFAIIGAWRTLDRGWPYILCWLPAVYFTSLHVVFVSSIRYREPAMLALLALAAAAILEIVGRKKRVGTAD